MRDNLTFKKDDVVSLKSGGQLMTVEVVTSGRGITCICVWFTGTVKHKESFDGELLVKIVKPDDNTSEPIEKVRQPTKGTNIIGENIPTMGSSEE